MGLLCRSVLSTTTSTAVGQYTTDKRGIRASFTIRAPSRVCSWIGRGPCRGGPCRHRSSSCSSGTLPPSRSGSDIRGEDGGWQRTTATTAIAWAKTKKKKKHENGVKETFAQRDRQTHTRTPEKNTCYLVAITAVYIYMYVTWTHGTGTYIRGKHTKKVQQTSRNLRFPIFFRQKGQTSSLEQERGL